MKTHKYKEMKGETIEIVNDMQDQEIKCLDCKIKMIKYKEDKSLFDGAMTFNFIKLRCPQCKKEYLNLEEAKKYDQYLKLKKMGREKALATLYEKRAKEIYA